jgi:site-specific recombinase XerD
MNIETAFQLCGDAAIASRSVNTARMYANALKLFAEFLESESISPEDAIEIVTMEHFIRFPSWLARLGYAKKTIGVYISGVKFFLDWLVINGSIRPDYSETLRYEMAVKQVNQKKETRLPRTPEKGAVEKILKILQDLEVPEKPRLRSIALRNRALIWFLMTTGCRNDETVKLKVKDIDLLGHKALVIGKGNRERRIFFNSQTAEALERYWAARGFREKTHPAFARHDRGVGKRIRALTTMSVRNIVDELTLQAGLDKGSFTPHYFRHAFAIRMLRETHDLALVQDLLGHASPASTRVYAKIYPDELEKAHQDVWENKEVDE